MRRLLAAFLALLAAAAPAAAQVAGSDWFPGSSSITETEIIPPGYRGKWTPNAANCADSDGVDHMFVYPNGVDFYEMGGRLERITQAGRERSVRMRLSFEGEGEFSDATWTVTLSEDGRRLTVSADENAPATDYVKCPA